MKSKSLKIVFFLFLALIGSFHTYLYADQSNDVYLLSDELQIRSIAKDTFLVTHSFPWPANSLLVRYPGRCIVWIDTPYTDSGTEQVWKWIKSDLGNEKIIEINTHLLIQKYNFCKMQEGQSVVEYVNNMIVMVKDLSIAGTPIPEKLQVATILNSLPNSFNIVTTTMRSTPSLELSELPTRLGTE